MQMLSTKPSLCRSLFLSERFSDVTIKVINRKDGYTYTYPAHSLILSAGSEVLGERMDLNMEDDKKLLTFVDLESDTVLLLLRFLYFGELPSVRSEEDLLQLLGAAHKLRIQPLQSECQNRILGRIKVENACRLLEISTKQCELNHGSAVISDACQKVILNYGQIIFSSDYVLDLSRTNLDTILQSDLLNVLDEETVYNGLWRWGKMGCCKLNTELTIVQIVDYLGDLLKYIRYSAIPRTDNIPQVVKDRFFLRKVLSCCLAENAVPKPKNRSPFRQPADLLNHCTAIKTDTFVPGIISNGTGAIGSHVRMQCAQFSFDADLYLCALSIEASHCGDELSETDSLVISIFAEETGYEVIRQEIHWEEVLSNKASNSEARAFFSTIRLAVPIFVGRGQIYSVQLVPQTATTTGTNSSNWSFRTTHILRRTVSVDNFLTVTMHSINLVALSSIYVIPIKNVATVTF